MKAWLLVLLLVAALGAGCGDDDDSGGEGGAGDTPKPVAAAATSEDAEVKGPDGEKIVEVTTELLNAKDGDEPCYAIVASDYVESLGGLEKCAAKLGPIATGPLDTITAAGPSADGKTGTAEVESSKGDEKQTIKFAKTVAGEWRVDGLGGS